MQAFVDFVIACRFTARGLCASTIPTSVGAAVDCKSIVAFHGLAADADIRATDVTAADRVFDALRRASPACPPLLVVVRVAGCTTFSQHWLPLPSAGSPCRRRRHRPCLPTLGRRSSFPALWRGRASGCEIRADRRLRASSGRTRRDHAGAHGVSRRCLRSSPSSRAARARATCLKISPVLSEVDALLLAEAYRRWRSRRSWLGRWTRALARGSASVVEPLFVPDVTGTSQQILQTGAERRRRDDDGGSTVALHRRRFTPAAEAPMGLDPQSVNRLAIAMGALASFALFAHHLGGFAACSRCGRCVSSHRWPRSMAACWSRRSAPNCAARSSARRRSGCAPRCAAVWVRDPHGAAAGRLRSISTLKNTAPWAISDNDGCRTVRSSFRGIGRLIPRLTDLRQLLDRTGTATGEARTGWRTRPRHQGVRDVAAAARRADQPATTCRSNLGANTIRTDSACFAALYE